MADADGEMGAQESGHETNNLPPDSRLAVVDRASNKGSRSLREDITISEKAPTRVFSWLKAPTSAFTLKTLLRH